MTSPTDSARPTYYDFLASEFQVISLRGYAYAQRRLKRRSDYCIRIRIYRLNSRLCIDRRN